MFKNCLLFFLLIFASSFAFGQTVFKGRVFENKTRISLADITVQNLTNQLNTSSDNKGRFSINAKMGDILVFKGFAYLPDTLLITDMHEQEIFLVPHQNFLDEVKVTTDSTKNLSSYYDPEFHGQTVVYSRDAKMNYTGGITIRIHDWKKDEHKRERLEKQQKEEQQMDELTTVFSPKNVEKYVPLKGKDMDDFLVLYTPGIDVYFRYDFNLLSYLNDCYQKYLKLPEDKRHPKKLGTP